MQTDLAGLANSGTGKGLNQYTPEESNNIKQLMEKYKTNLEQLASIGQAKEDTTFISPAELAAKGYLTQQEAKDLQSFRAGTFIDVAGAIILPGGVKATGKGGKAVAEDLPPPKPKSPVAAANQTALDELNAGKLPGTPIGGPGTPREMPATRTPSAVAEDFATQALGRAPTAADLARGASMNNGDCPGCWRAKAADGTWVIYRPAGKASADTIPTTATVEINSPDVNLLNSRADGRSTVLKLKFPLTDATGAAK